MKKRKEQENKKINKSKEIIKKEKEKIKREKAKIKIEKQEKFYQTKLGKALKKVFPSKEKETSPSIKEQILSMLFFEVLGFAICLLFLFALSGGKNFLKIYKDLNKLINVYDTITTNYYGELDKDNLIDNAINSMLNSVGDSYTTYTDEDTTNNFLENVDGTYEGIGCLVSTNEVGNIYVVSIFENGPAAKAGLQEQDIILKINDQDFSKKNSEDMANYVKNSKESQIKLTIKRGEQEQLITIERKKVEIPSVSGKVIEQDGKKIGYIDISIFSSVTTDQFKKQLKQLEKQKIQGLIIDVRDNTGGYLSTVTDITNLFLKKGQVIYQLEGSKKTEKVKDNSKEKREYPIAVLVNSTSASASEILAAAIKESYKGYVVGTNTYGKGTVQKTTKLSDGSMIKYTVQKWLTPNGNWINETGLPPTHVVELSPESTQDVQLETALSLISKDIQ